MQNCCVQTSSSVSCTGGGGWEICLGRCRGRSKENAPGQRHKHAEGLPRNYTGPRNLRLTDRHTMHMAAPSLHFTQNVSPDIYILCLHKF